MNNQAVIKIHPMDNVAIALSDLPQGFYFHWMEKK